MTDADERENRIAKAKQSGELDVLARNLWDQLDDARAAIDTLKRAAIDDSATIATLRAQLASAETERNEGKQWLDNISALCIKHGMEPDERARLHWLEWQLGLVKRYHDEAKNLRDVAATAREQIGAAKTLADSWALNSGGYYGLPYSAAAKQLRAALTAPAKETSRG